MGKWNTNFYWYLCSHVCVGVLSIQLKCPDSRPSVYLPTSLKQYEECSIKVIDNNINLSTFVLKYRKTVFTTFTDCSTATAVHYTSWAAPWNVSLQKMLQYRLQQEGSSEETDPAEQSRWVNHSVPRLKDTLWCTGGDVKLDLWQDTMSIKWAASRSAWSGPLSDSCGVFDVGWGDCDGRRGRPHDALASVFRCRAFNKMPQNNKIHSTFWEHLSWC